jgi:hypothetical protein
MRLPRVVGVSISQWMSSIGSLNDWFMNTSTARKCLQGVQQVHPHAHMIRRRAEAAPHPAE